jgi:hypothetical protein
MVLAKTELLAVGAFPSRAGNPSLPGRDRFADIPDGQTPSSTQTESQGSPAAAAPCFRP